MGSRPDLRGVEGNPGAGVRTGQPRVPRLGWRPCKWFQRLPQAVRHTPHPWEALRAIGVPTLPDWREWDWFRLPRFGRPW